MYNVAFIYTEKAGGYEGIITWTGYSTKEEFQKLFTKRTEEQKKKERILEEGISEERCIELVKSVHPLCYILAPLQEAVDMIKKSLAEETNSTA